MPANINQQINLHLYKNFQDKYLTHAKKYFYLLTS